MCVCIALHKICVQDCLLCVYVLFLSACVCVSTRGCSLDEQSAPAVCDGWTDTGGQRGSANTPSYRGGRGGHTRMSVTGFSATGLTLVRSKSAATHDKKLSAVQDNSPDCQQSFTGCCLLQTLTVTQRCANHSVPSISHPDIWLIVYAMR